MGIKRMVAINKHFRIRSDLHAALGCSKPAEELIPFTDRSRQSAVLTFSLDLCVCHVNSAAVGIKTQLDRIPYDDRLIFSRTYDLDIVKPCTGLNAYIAPLIC